MFGFTAEDFEEEVEVWPDNVPAVNLFTTLGTQWLVGPGGAYGLNYQTLWQKMERVGIPPDEAEKLEADIRTLEDAALEQMRKDD